ncbi:MAG: PEP-CTERM sorting domain-containing protein [Phycisphaerae bacterium]|nr:PEP-CTERM sorting domain-containing protein [Phycisphaerae bacterium]
MSRNAIALLLILLVVLAAPSIAAADAIPLVGSVDNGEVRYEWEFFPTFGDAQFVISNIGTTPLTHFDLPITGLTEYEADPDVWTLSPETGTGMFRISSGSLRNGQSFLVDYLFDPDEVVLGYVSMVYTDDGDISNTLDGIVTTTPEPATLGMLAIASASLIRRKRR